MKYFGHRAIMLNEDDSPDEAQQEENYDQILAQCED